MEKKKYMVTFQTAGANITAIFEAADIRELMHLVDRFENGCPFDIQFVAAYYTYQDGDAIVRGVRV